MKKGGLVGPNINDSPDTLKEHIQSLPDLVELVNSTADDFGFDLENTPDTEDDERFLHAPVDGSSSRRETDINASSGNWVLNTRKQLIALSQVQRRLMDKLDAFKAAGFLRLREEHRYCEYDLQTLKKTFTQLTQDFETGAVGGLETEHGVQGRHVSNGRHPHLLRQSGDVSLGSSAFPSSLSVEVESSLPGSSVPDTLPDITPEGTNTETSASLQAGPIPNAPSMKVHPPPDPSPERETQSTTPANRTDSELTEYPTSPPETRDDWFTNAAHDPDIHHATPSPVDGAGHMPDTSINPQPQPHPQTPISFEAALARQPCPPHPGCKRRESVIKWTQDTATERSGPRSSPIQRPPTPFARPAVKAYLRKRPPLKSAAIAVHPEPRRVIEKGESSVLFQWNECNGARLDSLGRGFWDRKGRGSGRKSV